MQSIEIMTFKWLCKGATPWPKVIVFIVCKNMSLDRNSIKTNIIHDNYIYECL